MGIYPFDTLGGILANVVGILMLCILAEVVISWILASGGRVPLYNPIIKNVRKVAAFLTEPLRRVIRPLKLGNIYLDLSTWVAMIILGIGQQILFKYIP